MTRSLFITLVLLAACGNPALRAADDEAFRDLAQRVAAQADGHVIGWGTAPLADDDQPRRFAVIEPDDLRVGRGAYLIEDAQDALWLVSFAVDGRTELWGIASSREDDAWQIRPDRAIEHGQAHRRGGEEITFALRRGDLVVLSHDTLGEDDTEVVERQRFAVDGVCKPSCPPIREIATEDFDLAIVGPVDAL